MDIRHVHNYVNNKMKSDDKRILYYGKNGVKVAIERTDRMCDPGDFRVIIIFQEGDEKIPTHRDILEDLMLKKMANCEFAKEWFKYIECINDCGIDKKHCNVINECGVNKNDYDAYHFATNLKRLHFDGEAGKIPADVLFFTIFLLFAEQDWTYGEGYIQ